MLFQDCFFKICWKATRLQWSLLSHVCFRKWFQYRRFLLVFQRYLCTAAFLKNLFYLFKNEKCSCLKCLLRDVANSINERFKKISFTWRKKTELVFLETNLAHQKTSFILRRWNLGKRAKAARYIASCRYHNDQTLKVLMQERKNI